MPIEDSYKFIKDTTLRGTYQSAEVTATFYDYYGSRITTKTVQFGTTLGSASSGVSNGSGPSDYVFKGWASSRGSSSALSSSTKITSNRSFYAAFAPYTDTLTSGYLVVGELMKKLGCTDPSDVAFTAYITPSSTSYVGSPDSSWRLPLSKFANGSYMKCHQFQIYKNGNWSSYRITQINDGSKNISVALSAQGCAMPSKAKATGYA